MFRSFTVLLALLPLVLSIPENESGQIVLGLFQKVHIEPNKTSEDPLIFRGGATILNNTTTTKAENPNRIIGGRPVSIAEVPWQAALIQDRQFACGASVLSTIWVLTAGHCIYGLGNSTFVVRAGSSNFRTGGQLRHVGLMVVHGLYDQNRLSYDIAMLRVTRRFTFGSTLRPIRVATQYSITPNVFSICGWGTTSQNGSSPSRSLRGVYVNLVNQQTCASLYAESNFKISRNVICAGNLLFGGRDSCQGDSGGPLVSQGVQFGIVSFGIGCGQKQYPGVYTNVATMNSWISTVARSFSRSSHPDEAGEHDIKRVVVEMEQEDTIQF